MRALTLAACAATLLLATPVLAGPSARVSGGNINVRTGPGHEYAVIGKIPNGTEVPLDYCTRNDKWCFVTDTGWVDASYLVGWAGRMRVTPPNFMGPGW